MTRPLLKISALLAMTGFAALTAHAAEITLYEHSGFNGRQVELRDYTPNIGNIGFNDKASSIVVRSGRWEVCSDNDFKGYCAILERGEYRKLDTRLNDRVSSVREVGTTGSNVSRNDNGQRPVIELFGQAGFKGQSVQLDHDANNFSGSSINDRASSVIVTNGTWVLCSDAEYRGNCRTYAPGRYPDLGYGMANAISSARIIPNRNDAAPVHSGGWNRHDDDANTARIVLFNGQNLHGQSMSLSANVVDLSSAGFNDETASLVIESGYWELCSDAYFRGQCRVMAPGQYRRLDPALNRSISSLRVAGKENMDGRRSANADDVELFSGANFSGKRFSLRQDMRNFEQGGFNDQISSLVINAGQWELCVDADFHGRCTVFGPGRYANLGGYTNQTSSMRRVY